MNNLFVGKTKPSNITISGVTGHARLGGTIVWAPTWTSNTVYDRGQIVEYGSSYYEALRANRSNYDTYGFSPAAQTGLWKLL